MFYLHTLTAARDDLDAVLLDYAIENMRSTETQMIDDTVIARSFIEIDEPSAASDLVWAGWPELLGDGQTVVEQTLL